jgi:drug/metabolite transporter (DMT)-like permease
LGWLLWLYVLSTMSAGTAGMSTLAIPVVALLTSAIQLHEAPPWVELWGMALLGVALVLVFLRGRARAPAAAPQVVSQRPVA